MERSRECHPLLRGGKRRRNSRGKYNTHDFSSAQMESLGSICEALLPPIESEFLETKGIQPTSKAMEFFWKVSGSDLSIPHQLEDEILSKFEKSCLKAHNLGNVIHPREERWNVAII